MPATPKTPWHRERTRWIAARIRQARRAAGLTQLDLIRAAQLPYSQNWLSEVERAEFAVDPVDLFLIARATGFPLEWFIDPEYDQRSLSAPTTRLEWERLYDDRDLAAVHWHIDQFARRCREVAGIEHTSTEVP
ncbi:MAG: hypothetical protein KatS3mg064_0626 [Tepidiforma sp.]|nr:helix-turn-helix transcriptional regulator [Tepidiforma sp.]GIW17469.1 MAG: hypothetical protein KatS3mg064_0626 [Tepidiforma sp.]